MRHRSADTGRFGAAISVLGLASWFVDFVGMAFIAIKVCTGAMLLPSLFRGRD
ncbi:hypothetical protein BJX68DRAFT_232029 [Aspergillus pseudodeflectus]|uniref:Uncharacterized protein n=1 Tax=Aspergillus pseudodeflectus TaxID=176178 RepID=A0ABR4KQL6_9EURO